MKRSLQLCLVFLISLALPLSGMAGVRVQANPCPMTAAGMAKMADTGAGCCQDMGGSSEHGKPCKSGQECKSGSLLHLSAMKPPVTLSNPIVITYTSSLLATQVPSGLWRPPRI
ncbi:MAG: hypothetical protein WA173_07540 [Pseudomonas sp.]|uniref:hypothetical protein n=1 Tax=Pseudomonas sp. TaxID=306 RepID=UPI003BB622D6